MVGSLEVVWQAPHTLTDQEEQLLEAVAVQAAIAITNARLYQEKEHALQEAREQERSYRLLAEHATDLISRHTPAGVFRYVSPACRTLLGYDPAELIGHSAYEFFHPADIAAIQQIHEAVLHLPDTFTVCYRLRRKDGTYRWVETASHSLRDPQSGEVQEIIAVARDITERQQAQEALEAEATSAAALARVGQELMTVLGTPTMLQHLCQLTAAELGCDFSHTFLYQPQEAVYLPVAGAGEAPEQWAQLQALKIPSERMAGLVSRLHRGEVVQITTAEAQALLPAELGQQGGGAGSLWVALRRGQEIVGILSMGYRERPASFTPQQERLARGIAQLASLALQNAQLLEELEQANRLKSDFLATLSHELRTPLHIIMGYTELLLEGGAGPLTAEQTALLGRVDLHARELLELIIATLNASRLDTGQLAVEIQEVVVEELLAEVKAESQDLWEQRELSCEWRLSPELPRLRTDRTKLKVILKNLLGNAAKFTERGGVTVDVHPCRAGVEFCVTDTGIGIAPAVQTVMFEAFRQGDSSMTRRYGGLGLGLYIVRQMTALLGGTVAVESQLGCGSTFRVWLPPETPIAPLAEGRPLGSPDQRRKTCGGEKQQVPRRASE